jgi:hypothetical protein
MGWPENVCDLTNSGLVVDLLGFLAHGRDLGPNRPEVANV